MALSYSSILVLSLGGFLALTAACGSETADGGNAGSSASGAPAGGSIAQGGASTGGSSSGGANAGGSSGANKGGAAGSGAAGGASGGQAGGATGGSGAAAGQGGAAGQAGGSAGKAGSGGAQAGSGGSGGGVSPASACPAGPYAASPLPSGATPAAIPGIPPSDSFNNNGNDFGILEGPVWFDGALYVSEIASGNAPPRSRILKVTAADAVSIALTDTGTNGLAVDGSGNLVGCNHKTGAVTRLSLSGGASVDLVSMFMGQRFNSPNDLTFGSDGSLYFTDPNYQAPSPAPQATTRVYRVAPGSMTATPIVENRQQPNGVTLSPDGKTLYVSATDGVFAHPVMAGGSIGTGARFAQGTVSGGDGMGMDCAGNLYVTTERDVVVVSASGTLVGRLPVAGVQSVTNVAFGGADAKTLYITSLGAGGQRGVHKVNLAIPGFRY